MSRYNQIGNTATTVSTDGAGNTALTYHQTRVVVWNDQFITLNSGGYLTNTTKLRMNQVSTVHNLGYSVAQTKGQWNVYTNHNWDHPIPFFDGMMLDRGAISREREEIAANV